jgi:hypothetical protein
MTTIKDFKAAISSHGFNAGNRFDVMIFTRAVSMPRFLSQYVESVSLPGRSFSTSDIKVGTGFTQKRPYNSVFDDVTMTIRLDEDLLIKKYFDDWQNVMHNKGTGYMSYLDEYKSSIEIRVFDKSNSVIYTCKLFEAYPISVAALDMNHSTQNDIAKLSVTFAYKTWGSQ